MVMPLKYEGMGGQATRVNNIPPLQVPWDPLCP